MEMLNGENKNKGEPRARWDRRTNERTSLISARMNLIREVLLGAKRFVVPDHVEMIIVPTRQRRTQKLIQIGPKWK